MARKDLFGNPVVEHKLIERDLLAKMLSNHLRSLSLEQFSRLLVTEFDCIVEFSKLCKGGNAGQTISLLFNPHRLDTSASPNGDRRYPLSKELLRVFPGAKEIKSELSGSGGLRSSEGRERFYLLRKTKNA